LDIFIRLKNLLAYRSLISTLVLKELKTRYRGSVLGFIWSFLNPLLFMLVYIIVFSVYMRINVNNYALFLFCGLLPWIWFSQSLLNAASSIVNGGALIKKVVFPIEILPIVSVITNLVNFLLGLPILFLFIYIFKIKLGYFIIFLPILIIIQALMTIGLSLVLSAINVHLRDVEQILTNLLNLFFFLTPILYPISTIPERYRGIILLNPMALLMISYQDILFNGKAPDWRYLLILIIISILIFIYGYIIFDRFKDSLIEEV